jgi:hypothetical protein
MTEPATDHLTGRALDAAVARLVFSLDAQERTNARTGARNWVCREPGRDWNVVAYYGSLGASIKLELKLADIGSKVKPSPLGRTPDASGVVLVSLVIGEQQVAGSGHSFEEALCRAALKAVGRV